MPYRLAIDPAAQKEWARLDKSVKKRFKIVHWLVTILFFAFCVLFFKTFHPLILLLIIDF